MIFDRDVWASAKLLRDQHGNDAVIQAAMKADELGTAGDLAGQRTWLRIIRAIEWLADNRGRDPFKVEHSVSQSG